MHFLHIANVHFGCERKTGSRQANIKTAAEYIAMFPEYTVEKKSSHMLCQDHIAFIKLRCKRD